jgi:crotonobetainyl-CoA:carnitine CoA-transferase CaiB-like acyl-CoA transferase
VLSGLRVLEVSKDPAVRFCGWMFASNGAAVTRIERPDPATDRADRWSDAYLNTGKNVLNASDDDLVPLLIDAHIVIADSDFDWVSVGEANICPPPITGTVDAFGHDGPCANWQSSEAVLASLGGASIYTRDRAGTPVYGFGDRYQYLTGVYLYTTLVSCHLAGQRPAVDATQWPLVRISAFESVVSLLPYLTTQYEYNGSQSVLEQSGPRFICRCSDGFVVIYAGLGWSDLVAVLGDRTLAGDERFVRQARRFEHIEELTAIFDAWCADRTVREAEAAGHQHDVAICAVTEPERVLADPDLDRRDAWAEICIGAAIGRVPKLPYTVNGHRPGSTHPAIER